MDMVQWSSYQETEEDPMPYAKLLDGMKKVIQSICQ